MDQGSTATNGATQPVVRIAKGEFDSDRLGEVKRLTAESATPLVPAIQELPGLLYYHAAVDANTNTVVNVSIWETETDARRLEMLAAMRAQRPMLEAAGVQFSEIAYYQPEWKIERRWSWGGEPSNQTVNSVHRGRKVFHSLEALNRLSPLFWFSLATALGIILLGATFLLAPRLGAEVYGIPLNDGNGLAFAFAMGIRDLFAGIVGLPFIFWAQRRIVAWIIGAATMIPIADGFILIHFSGMRPIFLSLHWGSALYMMILAFLLFRGVAVSSLTATTRT